MVNSKSPTPACTKFNLHLGLLGICSIDQQLKLCNSSYFWNPNTMQWKKYETLFKAPNPFTFLIKTQNRNYLFMSWLLMEICSLFWRICWIYFEIFFFLVLLWKIVKHSFRLPKEVKLFGKFWCEHPMMTTKMIKWELGNKKGTYTLKL